MRLFAQCNTKFANDWTDGFNVDQKDWSVVKEKRRLAEELTGKNPYRTS